MRIQSAARFAQLQAKRIAQTPAAFANWPEVLRSIAMSRIGRGPETLTFRTRDGLSISVPNTKGAFVPPYEVFAEDCYHLRWFLGDLVDRPIHAIDVGAHVGAFACALAQLHPSATVDCFEPAESTVGYLRRNVLDNGFGERIQVHAAALAAQAGFATFEESGQASGLNRLGSGAGGVTVETVTFDSVASDARGPLELVKMDCEGGEYDLVLASSAESWSTVQRVVLEYHVVEGRRWSELRSWLGDVGLTVVREEPSRDSGLGLAWLSRSPLT